MSGWRDGAVVAGNPGTGRPGDSEALATLVRSCARSGVTRRVLLLRSDRLPPALSRPHHLRLARDALAPLEAADRARLFDLPASRVAVAWRGEGAGVLNRALALFGHLVADAPPDTPPLSELVAVYELPRDGPMLLEALRDPPAYRPLPPARKLDAADAAGIAAMELALIQADVSRFIRRRPVIRYAPAPADGPAENGPADRPPASDGSLPVATLEWEARTLSMSELAAALAPGRDLRAAPWLFRRLCRTLDRRMLALLTAPGELHGTGPFAIELNTATITGPEFLRLDAALPARLRGCVVLGVRPADLLADPGGYLFARDFARSCGYRVLLQGVDAALLPLLDLDRLDPDYVALRWSPGLAEAGVPADPARLVLARADTAAALRWGRERGIALFQGAAASPD